jgi:hypothetical protein
MALKKAAKKKAAKKTPGRKPIWEQCLAGQQTGSTLPPIAPPESEPMPRLTINELIEKLQDDVDSAIAELRGRTALLSNTIGEN